MPEIMNEYDSLEQIYSHWYTSASAPDVYPFMIIALNMTFALLMSVVVLG